MSNVASAQTHFEVLLTGEAEVLCTWQEVAQVAGLLKTVTSPILGSAYGIERDGLILQIDVVIGNSNGPAQSSDELALFVSRKDRLSPAETYEAKELVLDFVAAFPDGAVRPIASVQDGDGNFSWIPLVRTSPA